MPPGVLQKFSHILCPFCMNGANHNVAACALVQAPLGQKVVVAANLFVKFGSPRRIEKNVAFSTARRRAVTNLRLGERIPSCAARAQAVEESGN